MKNIVILGAGPAGFTVGYWLVNNSKQCNSVTILEKTDKIVGISRTENHDGNRIDIGGIGSFLKLKL